MMYFGAFSSHNLGEMSLHLEIGNGQNNMIPTSMWQQQPQKEHTPFEKPDACQRIRLKLQLRFPTSFAS